MAGLINDTPEAVEAARLAADAALGEKALATTLGGGATAVYGGFTASEIAMFIGGAVAVGGFIVQLVVQWHAWRLRRRQAQREDERARLDMERAVRDAEWHAARMARLKVDTTFQFSSSGEAPLGE